MLCLCRTGKVVERFCSNQRFVSRTGREVSCMSGFLKIRVFSLLSLLVVPSGRDSTLVDSVICSPNYEGTQQVPRMQFVIAAVGNKALAQAINTVLFTSCTNNYLLSSLHSSSSLPWVDSWDFRYKRKRKGMCSELLIMFGSWFCPIILKSNLEC